MTEESKWKNYTMVVLGAILLVSIGAPLWLEIKKLKLNRLTNGGAVAAAADDLRLRFFVGRGGHCLLLLRDVMMRDGCGVVWFLFFIFFLIF